ncbi:MAG: NIL domain-containing protein [Actinomycetota bacterium]
MSRAHLHLTFPQHLIDEPVLHRLSTDLEVIPNIRRANVDGTSAWVILSLDGTDDAIAAAIAWLEGNGVDVKRLEDEG